MSRRSDSVPIEDEPVARRKRGKRKPAGSEIRASTPKSRRGRRGRWPFVLFLLGLVVFFLPNLVGWLGLQQVVIDYGLEDFNGTVSADKASLGWFSPIELTGVTATDAQGNPMIRVARISSSKTLLAFLTTSDYGQFNFIEPAVQLNLRSDGSNLEDAIARYLISDEDNVDPYALPKFTIKISDGQIDVSSGQTNAPWRIDELDLVVQASSATAPLSLAVRCRVASSAVGADGVPVFPQGGRLEFSGQIDAGSDLFQCEVADFQLDAQKVPLSIAGPVMHRFSIPASTTGNLNGKVSGRYDAKTKSFSVEADRLNIAGLSVTAPGLLESDQIAIDNVTVHGDVQLTSTLVSADQFSLQSDFGWIKADGSFDINQVANLATQGQLLDTPFKMDGEINLAQLVRMLPATLQLHDDLVVESGTVSFQANSRKENGNRRLVFNLDTANLKAQRGGRAILWAKPLRLVGTLRESKGQLAIEGIECTSDFLTIRGHASRQTAAFSTDGDLSRLMEKVGQFVDLQGTRLEGVFEGQFGWEAGSTEVASAVESPPMQIGGHLTITEPVIAMPGMPVWQPPQLSFKVNMAGRATVDQKLQLDQGGLQVDVGSEQAVVKLSAPVADAWTHSLWRLNCRITGSVESWMGHAGNFVDLGEISAEGKLNLTADALLSPTVLQFSNIQYDIEQFVFAGMGVIIREPKIAGTGAVEYDMIRGDIMIPDVVLSSSAFSVRGQPLKMAFEKNIRVDGSLAFRADVNRISEWVDLSPTDESVSWFGSVEGTIQLVSNENGIGGRLHSTISDLVAAKQVTVPVQPHRSGQMMTVSQPTRAWKELLREPKVVLSGDASFENDFDSVRFRELSLDSLGVKVKADGSIADLGGAMEVDFVGTWNPSWEKMNAVLAETTGGIMRFSGQKDQDFRIRGPLSNPPSQSIQPGAPTPLISPAIQASIGFGWDRGEILNLPVGQSQIDLIVRQSIAELETSGVPFAGGRVKFAPRIDLRGDQPIMTLHQTRVIDRVELKPETARQWLRYVAPLLADATSAKGTFSVDVEQARIPLFTPMQAEMKGSVQLSNVVIKGGPVAEQLLSAINQIQMLLNPGTHKRDVNIWLKLSEQTVPVIIQNGRMYHEHMEFSHKEIVIRTAGSVGLDQSLDLVAQITIADEWIADRPLLAGLRGRSILIPITGTVSKPKLDLRAMHEFNTKLAKEALGNVFKIELEDKITPKVNELQNEFNNQLNREFNKFQDKLFGK